MTATLSASPDLATGLKAILTRQREAFLRDGAPSTAQRRQLLGRLRDTLLEHQQEMAEAIDQDFGHRSRHETLLGETFRTVSSIDHSIRHLASWMKPERRSVPLQFRPGRADVVYQPLGVVGIISPWNYPWVSPSGRSRPPSPPATG
jgi:coniferyl-aldehyde dehydrogenase